MASCGRARAALLTAAVLALALAPVVSAQDGTERLVPQSLWGVKQNVGLGPAGEFLSNHGERSFWQERPKGEGVRVAVVDTGIDLAHPDLQGALACGHCWIDLVGGRAEPYDDNGHGTHVAAIVAGRGHFQPNPLASYFPTGARGLAPGAGLIVAKAMNDTGGGTDDDVARAIRWALDPDKDPDTDDGAHIIHLSLGVETRQVPALPAITADSKTEDAVRAAIQRGVFVVLSAGNQGREGVAAPGEVEGVIAVGALDNRGRVLSFSNRGEHVDLFAPGVIMSAWPRAIDEDGLEDGYTGLAGTSQAAPVVTGAIALAIGANPALAKGGGATKVAHVERLLRETGLPVEGSAGAVALDAGAFFTTQDGGTDGVAWPVVLGLLLAALMAATVIMRIVVGLLRRNAERHAPATFQRENGPPPQQGDDRRETTRPGDRTDQRGP